MGVGFSVHLCLSSQPAVCLVLVSLTAFKFGSGRSRFYKSFNDCLKQAPAMQARHRFEQVYVLASLQHCIAGLTPYLLSKRVIFWYQHVLNSLCQLELKACQLPELISSSGSPKTFPAPEVDKPMFPRTIKFSVVLGQSSLQFFDQQSE